MIRDNVLQDMAVQEWKRYISPSARTWERYTYSLTNYCNHIYKTPTQLIEEAEAELGTPSRFKKYRAQVMAYREKLEDEGLSQNTVKVNIAAIRSFYSSFGITLDLGKSKKALPKEENMKIPSIENIRKVLEVADPLTRAVILVGCSSGLGMNEIINLKINQFLEGYDETTGITTLYIRREKVQYDHITFLTPEASQAVRQYLDYRNKVPDSYYVRVYGAYFNRRVHSNTGYLFIKSSISPDFKKTMDEELRKLNTVTFTAIYRRIASYVQEKQGKGEYGLMRSHAMRKVFFSNLINAGCDSMIAEFFMGHTLDGTRSAYYRASPEKLKEIYMRYVPALTIQPALNIEQSEEYQRAIAEKNELAALHIKRDLQYDMELKKYKERMEEMERMLKELSIEKLAAEVEKIVLKSGRKK